VSAVPFANGPADALRRKIVGLSPAAAAMAYPFLLQAFHLVVSPPDFADSPIRLAGAAVLLVLVFAIPLSGLAFAYWLTRAPPLLLSGLRAPVGVCQHRRAATLCFRRCRARTARTKVTGSGTLDRAVDTGGPLRLVRPGGAYAETNDATARCLAHRAWGIRRLRCLLRAVPSHQSSVRIGPGTHAATMKAGRTVYRAALIEPVLVILLLLQVASGLRLAWRWSSVRNDAYRIFQIGSGAYLAAFILTHMNSALVSARAVHKIETDWSWASGAPVGLIHDAWNIRLLPHYALGVFFIVGHLFSGLRVVMLAHGARTTVAYRVWTAGLTAGAVISAAIVCALCGVRV